MSSRSVQESVAFPRLSSAEIAALAPLGTRLAFEDGQALFEAGEQQGGFFIVLSGAVAILDRSGDEARTVIIHQPGEFTGDIDILSRRRPVVSAVAQGATEVIHIASADIRRIIAEQQVLGERLLKAFIARREQLVASGFQGARIIGSERSRPALQIRDFLTRNQVPFTWISVEEEPSVGELLAQFGVADEEMPVLLRGDHLLRNPSIRELAQEFGLKRPLHGKQFDMVVIGAGPAGLAAAVYASSEGLRTLVVDSVAPGGQAGASTRIENYLGFPTGISGADLMGRAVLQAQKFGAEFSMPSVVTGLDLEGPLPTVLLDGDERVEGRSVLIATGVDYRKLNVPERQRFDGVGVYYAATQAELASCRGARVVVVGGGNSAGQAVMFLSQETQGVLLLLRSDDLRKSMSSYLATRVERAKNVEILLHTEIRHMIGDQQLQAVEIENTRTGERNTIATPAVFSFIGAEPRTGWLPAGIEVNGKGFICTGRDVSSASANWSQQRHPFLLETSQAGIFAAGDVRLNSIKRVASAVGEGAMAVKYIHEFLAMAER